MASAAGKPSLTRPELKWPTQTPSTSAAVMPASSIAPLVTLTIKSSSVPSRRPKGVCAHPTMLGFMTTPLEARDRPQASVHAEATRHGENGVAPAEGRSGQQGGLPGNHLPGTAATHPDVGVAKVEVAIVTARGHLQRR